VLKDHLDDLKKYDLQAEIIPFIKGRWLTPGGGLKKEGWTIRLSFGYSLKGSKTLLTFIDYTSALKDKYGKNAFRYFVRADTRIMMN
jgi:hypothetical protein